MTLGPSSPRAGTSPCKKLLQLLLWLPDGGSSCSQHKTSRDALLANGNLRFQSVQLNGFLSDERRSHLHLHRPALEPQAAPPLGNLAFKVPVSGKVGRPSRRTAAAWLCGSGSEPVANPQNHQEENRNRQNGRSRNRNPHEGMRRSSS